MTAEDEARAAAYRESLAARASFADEIQDKLKAVSEAPAQRVRVAWAPVSAGWRLVPVTEMGTD